MPLLLRGAGSPMGMPSRDDFVELLRRREEVYGLTKRLSGSNRQKELKPHLDAQRKYCYKLNPATRYGSLRNEPGAPSPRSSGKPRMAFHAGWMTAPAAPWGGTFSSK